MGFVISPENRPRRVRGAEIRVQLDVGFEEIVLDSTVVGIGIGIDPVCRAAIGRLPRQRQDVGAREGISAIGEDADLEVLDLVLVPGNPGPDAVNQIVGVGLAFPVGAQADPADAVLVRNHERGPAAGQHDVVLRRVRAVHRPGAARPAVRRVRHRDGRRIAGAEIQGNLDTVGGDAVHAVGGLRHASGARPVRSGFARLAAGGGGLLDALLDAVDAGRRLGLGHRRGLGLGHRRHGRASAAPAPAATGQGEQAKRRGGREKSCGHGRSFFSRREAARPYTIPARKSRRAGGAAGGRGRGCTARCRRTPQGRGRGPRGSSRCA